MVRSSWFASHPMARLTPRNLHCWLSLYAFYALGIPAFFRPPESLSELALLPVQVHPYHIPLKNPSRGGIF